MSKPEQSPLVAVILAGGRGERFWPKSRAELPKQFLPLLGPRTLLQETYGRARALTDTVYVVTGSAQANLVRQQLPDLPEERLIAEPCGRDTAAALALAAAVAERRLPTCTLVVLPADHLVRDARAFRAACAAAMREAQTGRLVLLGLTPTRPETAYGYIVPEHAPARGGAAPVQRFLEKPPQTVALDLVREGRALWNAGMFVGRASAFLEAVDRHLPETRAAAEALALRPASRAARAAYQALVPVSVDKGVLEHAERVSVVAGRFVWDDVGSWGAVSRLTEPDQERNVVRGRALAIDSHDVLLDSDGGRLVVAFGLEEVLVVDTPDAVLVAKGSRASDLKEVTRTLRERGYGHLLEHAASQVSVPAPARTVEKPWGREVWWAETDLYLAKILEIEPGHAISLQLHEVKAESMLILQGEGILRLGERTTPATPGLRVDIPPGLVHRLTAGRSRLVVLEVSTPHADDVVRLDDRYSRVTKKAPA